MKTGGTERPRVYETPWVMTFELISMTHNRARLLAKNIPVTEIQAPQHSKI